MKHLLRLSLFVLSFCTVAVFATTVQAQVASALIRENEELPGAPGSSISGINNSAVNDNGGYSFTVTTDGSVSHVWGSTAGAPGSVILTETTYGDLIQTSFESFFGMSDSGSISYSASTNHISGTPSGLDGAWRDTAAVLNEEDAITELPGQFSTFNSRPGITADNKPYWVGGYSDTQGGSTQNRALFIGTEASVVLKSGDNISGVVEPLSAGSAIDFDFRFSALGTNYISPVDVDSGSAINDFVMASNGAAMMAGGSIIREASPIPASIGGLAGENYDNFDFFGITETGSYLITGDSDAGTTQDEFVMVDGQIILREGDMVDGFVLNGTIEGAFLNEDGDWAAIWDVDTLSGNVEVLIINGTIVLMEGDLVDWNNDGVIDGLDQNAFVEDFTGISALTMSGRDGAGNVNVVFTADADVNGSQLEGGFRIPVGLGTGVTSVESFMFTAGDYTSGTLADLAESDNLKVRGQRRFTDIQSRVHIEFKGTSPAPTPSSFEFTLEASVFARGLVSQRIEFFDYDLGDWEQVDIRDASRFGDIVTVAVGAGDLSRFVEPGTNCIEARVLFRSASQRQQFSASVDQTFWTIDP
ncbi:MAG: hypothetical protein AAF456_01950 [Planctomycetota bacterium]